MGSDGFGFALFCGVNACAGIPEADAGVGYFISGPGNRRRSARRAGCDTGYYRRSSVHGSSGEIVGRANRAVSGIIDSRGLVAGAGYRAGCGRRIASRQIAGSIGGFKLDIVSLARGQSGKVNISACGICRFVISSS